MLNGLSIPYQKHSGTGKAHRMGYVMGTVAVIQARVGSTRLPGKVMLDLAGRPVLEHVIRRVQACGRADETVVS